MMNVGAEIEPEFSRLFDLKELEETPRIIDLNANEECDKHDVRRSFSALQRQSTPMRSICRLKCSTDPQVMNPAFLPLARRSLPPR